MLKDDLSIPDFLKLTPQERAEGWEASPPKTEHPAFHPEKPKADPALEGFLAAEEERKKLETANRIAKMKIRMATKAIDTTGMRWDTVRAKWVPIQGGKPVSVPKPKETIPATTTKTSAPGTGEIKPDAATKRSRGSSEAKHALMMEMLTREGGATKPEIGKATNWEPHTAGARISGIKGAYTVTKTKEARGTVYRAIKK